jgi:Outer membrane protein beta-barrel domain
LSSIGIFLKSLFFWQGFCKTPLNPIFLNKKRNMKTKLSVLLFLSVISFSVQAQIIRAGVNAATISITNDGDVDENKILGSFQVGFIGDFKLTSFLYLQPGVLFTGKGSKTESGKTSEATYYRATSNPYYAEIPVNIVFKTPNQKKGVRFFAGAGPYLGIGVAGRNKVEGKFLGVAFKSEEDIEFSKDDPGTVDYEEGAGFGIMKRFDYGVNLTTGIETKHAVIGLGYGHGLAKLQSGSNSSADDKNKHRVLSLTVGIRL